MTRNIFTTDHCEATDARPLEDLSDFELERAIHNGRPGALTEETLRVYLAKLGIPRARVAPMPGRLG